MALPLKTSALQELAYGRRTWHCILPPGTTIEQASGEAYFAEAGKRKLRIFDVIEFDAADGSFCGAFKVRDVYEKRVIVELLWCKLLGARAPAPVGAPPYFAKLLGTKRWGVVRQSDKATIRDDFGTREAADEFIVKNLGELASFKVNASAPLPA
jgi:hypothetical protein